MGTGGIGIGTIERMKRLGNIFEDICDLENLTLAFAQVQKAKVNRSDIVSFREHLEENLEHLRQELLEGRYDFGHYHQFRIFDPKERLISAAPVRERVIHHAVINLCGERLERCLIDDSYACRRGKGQWAAVARSRQFARRHPWCLKLDIKSYFDSIDHHILLQLLCRLVKDQRLLELFQALVDSYETAPGKGLPIGNLTSQYFANLYLNGFDRLAVSDARRAYVRYMDDMLVFGDKEELKVFWKEAASFLQMERALKIKNGGALQPTSRGVDFLGCRVFPCRLALNRRSFLRFRRRRNWLLEAMEAGRVEEAGGQLRLTALYGFVRHTDTEQFRRRLVEQGDLDKRLEPRDSWRQLEQQRAELPCGEPQQQQPVERQQQQRVPPCLPPSSGKSFFLNHPNACFTE